MTNREKVGIALSVAAAIGGIVALIRFFESRKTKRLQEEIVIMDHELKRLELDEKKRRA